MKETVVFYYSLMKREEKLVCYTFMCYIRTKSTKNEDKT